MIKRAVIVLILFLSTATPKGLPAINYWGGNSSCGGCCYRQSCCCSTIAPTLALAVGAVAVAILVIIQTSEEAHLDSSR